MELDSICNICGKETEDEYHATVSCTKARALRMEMRKSWNLPAEEKFKYTGKDWLQLLLDTCTVDVRQKILLLLWRAWWLREDCVHSKGRATIGASVQFLTKYYDELGVAGMSNKDPDAAMLYPSQDADLCSNQAMAAIIKGKQPIAAGTATHLLVNAWTGGSDSSNHAPRSKIADEFEKWMPPDSGIWKMNCDASFISSTGDTNAGVVVRDCNGRVALSICKRLSPCSSSEEAEMAAILCGLTELRKRYYGQLCIETDCATVASILKSTAENQSALFPLIADARALMNSFKEVSVSTVKRSRNKLAHELAALARRSGDFTCVANVPHALRKVLAEDCNHPPGAS